MFTIFYRATSYNLNRSYPQNMDRYARHTSAETMEEVNAKIAEIKANGGREIKVYNNIGHRVPLEF